MYRYLPRRLLVVCKTHGLPALHNDVFLKLYIGNRLLQGEVAGVFCLPQAKKETMALDISISDCSSKSSPRFRVGVQCAMKYGLLSPFDD